MFNAMSVLQVLHYAVDSAVQATLAEATTAGGDSRSFPKARFFMLIALRILNVRILRKLYARTFSIISARTAWSPVRFMRSKS